MKGGMNIDFGAKTVTFALTLEAIEDGGPAIDALRGACETLWGLIDWDIPARGELEEEDKPEVTLSPALEQLAIAGAEKLAAMATQGAVGPSPKHRAGWGDPKPGSMSARVIAAAKKLKTTDPVAIAVALQVKFATAALCLARLRQAGILAKEGVE